MALDLSFKELADSATQSGGLNGRPLLIPLVQIDEDPDQPRRVFSESGLIELAETIRSVGVLQPIVARLSEISGRYVIKMGARRYRAAKLAGLNVIPVIILDEIYPDRYAQMIENIQRDDLAVSDIAAFIVGRLDAGEKQADICRRLGKPKDWVSRYAAISRMPDFLQAKLHVSSIRAIYELYQAWREQPEAIEQTCSLQDNFTDAEARRIAREVRAFPHTAATPIPTNELGRVRDAVGKGQQPKPFVSLRNEPTPPDQSNPSQVLASPYEKRKHRLAVSILVRHNDRLGRLLMEGLATNGSRFADVLFSETDKPEELPVSELRIEEIVRG